MRKRRKKTPGKTRKTRKKSKNKAADVSGLLGERVTVHKSNNRVVVTNRPKRKKGKLTAALRTQRKNFKLASQYAIAQSNDPASAELYAARIRGKHESAYTVALADYLNPPEVDRIDASEYKGAIGGVVNVHAFDGFGVTKVTVKISDANGAVIEQGEANEIPLHPNMWEYKAVAANPSRVGTKITATAYDRPGNAATMEVVL